MTDSERIAELEKELAQLRAFVYQMFDLVQRAGGANRAAHTATLALVQHQAGPELAALMQQHFLRAGASIVAESQNESHVEAFQDAEKVLLHIAASQRGVPPG